MKVAMSFEWGWLSSMMRDVLWVESWSGVMASEGTK
jgi:hypothetical protein